MTTCLICGQNNLEPKELCVKDYLSNKEFRVEQCPHCRCMRTLVPTVEQKQNFYGENYYNNSTGKFAPVLEKIFRLNHARNARYLRTSFPANRILEVGCGRGYLLRELKRLGASVHCLESADAADWILDNQEVQVTTLSDQQEQLWPFPGNFFQLIIFWHVLEHLPSPAANLQQAYNCLEPGGTLCVSVPNITSLQAKMNQPTWFHLDVPRHLIHFSQDGLVTLMEKQGFEIVRIAAGDRMQNLFGWLQSIANLLTPRHCNSFYRLIQGGKPLRGAHLPSLMLQLLTSWIWIPFGVLGFIVEEISQSYGTVTVYAKKSATSINYKENCGA